MNRLMLNLRDPELTEPPRENATSRQADASIGFTTEYVTTFIEPGPSRDSGEDYHQSLDRSTAEFPSIAGSRV